MKNPAHTLTKKISLQVATSCRIVRKTVVHEDNWVTVSTNDVYYNNGEVMTDYILLEEKYNFVLVAARDLEGNFILVKQCKPASGLSYECPAGGIEPDEDWKNAAARELLEETGYVPGSLHVLGSTSGIFTRTDRLTSRGYLTLASNCSPSNKQAQGDELQGVEHYLVSPGATLRMITDGEIRDSSTIAAIYASLYGEQQQANLLPV